MSDTKYLIFEKYIIEKVDEITKKLESDIKKEKETNSNDRYSGDYPWECLLEELKQIGIEHRREYVGIDYSCFCDDMETYTEQEHIEEHFPDWKYIYEETSIEKHKREREVFRMKLNQDRKKEGLDELPTSKVISPFGMN